MKPHELVTGRPGETKNEGRLCPILVTFVGKGGSLNFDLRPVW